MQRVRLGGLGAATGLFIAKPGKDISSTSFDDFLFHVGASDKLPRPLFSGIITSYKTSGFPTLPTVIAHNLGFVPLCFVSTTDTDDAPLAQVTVDSANLSIGPNYPANVSPSGVSGTYPYANGAFLAYAIWNARLA